LGEWNFIFLFAFENGLSDAILKVIIMVLFFLDLFFAAGFFYRFLYGFLKKKSRKLKRW
jgi:hypothetical protein